MKTALQRSMFPANHHLVPPKRLSPDLEELGVDVGYK